MDEKSLLRGSGRMRRCRWFLKVLFNILAPWLLFWAVYSATVGWLHHYWPNLTWTIVVCAWIFVVVTVIVYRKSARRGKVYDAIWGLFLTLSLALSIIAGTMIGNKEYETYWHRFYDFQALESYVNINPVVDTGKAFMDGGQYYFKEGTHVDTTRVVAFKNFDIYCIAPLIREELEDAGKATAGWPGVEMLDWFAVGMNCCDPDGEAWTCAPGNARAGLRSLDEDHRAFYTMASTMWSIKYDIPSKNPIFVDFMVDPLGKIGGLGVVGGLMYWNNVYYFLGLDIFVVLLFVTFLETQQ